MNNIASLRYEGQREVSLLPLDEALIEPELNRLFCLDSPIRLLHRMIVNHQSGRLCIADPHDSTVLWEIFVGNGQIHFAHCLAGQNERLGYFLQKAGIILPADERQISGYQFLCSQWQMGRLTLAQLRTVLILMTQDALLQVLKLSKASIRIDRQLGLGPLLISLPIVKLLSPILSELRLWQSALPEILSPLQRPSIVNPSQWNQLLRAPKQSLPKLYLIQHFLERQFCLYQIAQEMGIDLIKLVPLFQTLVSRNLIRMQPYCTQMKQSKPRIACIDASREVQASLSRVLAPESYEVISLTEPDAVWTTLMKFKPQLLLLDVDYFDGFSFMKALLQTEPFKTVPIVTLTEHDGIINRLWARRSGATECLVKPLNPKLLIPLVQQFTYTVTP